MTSSYADVVRVIEAMDALATIAVANFIAKTDVRISTTGRLEGSIEIPSHVFRKILKLALQGIAAEIHRP